MSIYVKTFVDRLGHRMPQSRFHELAEMADFDADTLKVIAHEQGWTYVKQYVDLQSLIYLAFPNEAPTE